MNAIPSSLSNAFPDVNRQVIEAWWAGLPPNAREEVARLCDERLDACFFGVVADERDHVVPTVHGGRFVPTDDAWGFDEWGRSYFDHLMAHPELVLVYDPTLRTFHTGCTRHPLARACWVSGSVPSGFGCPFGNIACLMRPLRGRRLQLRTAKSRERPLERAGTLCSDGDTHDDTQT